MNDTAMAINHTFDACEYAVDIIRMTSTETVVLINDREFILPRDLVEVSSTVTVPKSLAGVLGITGHVWESTRHLRETPVGKANK